MKTHIIYWAIGLLMINTLSGQVKIGDNPQSIHPASILELESNTGALVISRVTTAEMNNIVPLDGAMVYNIEEDCLHYYNGTEWVNLCEDNRITFSTLALFNPTSRDSTVVITSEDTPDGINYNFEVNKITSENIANNTVLREDLSFGIIGQQQLQDGAVTNPKLDKANIPLSGFGIPTADVSMGNAARITNLVNPTAPQDAATMSYVDARADDDITGVIFTPATNQLTVNEGTTTFSADLSALEESADIATNTANITANTTAINDHIADDLDLDITNEIQNIEEVLADGNNANGAVITGLGTPTVATDAATKAYVDTEITNNAADGSETIVNAGTDINITGNGTAATPYVINSTFAETQDLADVIANDPSAGNSRITNVLDPTDPQDAATMAYVDTEITNNAADGSETIVNAGTDINITGNGTAATPYVINSTFAETQDLADVIANDPSAGNSRITNVLDPTDPQDAATMAYVDTEITNNAADGTETSVNGAGINVVTGDGSTGNPYVVTGTEAQDLADVIAIDPSAGNSRITNVLDPTDPQDAATMAYVDTEITNNAADGTETSVNGAGINVVTGDGSTGNPYVVTGTEAQDLADVIAIDPSAGNSRITNVLDPTDPQDAATMAYVDTEITNNAADGTETSVNGAGINVVTGDGSTGNPYVVTGTEAQDLADVIAIDPSAGNSRITNVLDPTDPQDAATMSYVDTFAEEIALSAQVPTGTGVAGAYTIFNAAIAANSIIQLTVEQNTVGNPVMIQLTNQVAGSFSVQIYEFIAPGFVPTAANANWQYIVVNP